MIEDSVVIGDNVDTDGALARAIGANFLLFHARQDDEIGIKGRLSTSRHKTALL